MDLGSVIIDTLRKRPTRAEISLSPLPKASYFHLSANSKLNYVSARLRFMEKSFLDLLGIPKFHPITHESTKPFYTFGMVSSVTGAPIDSSCCLFNTEDGSNTPVALNLAGMERYSLYNGQIVAIKGRNMSGFEIIVESVYSLPIINVNSQTRSPLNIHIARGPFTTATINSLMECTEYVLILFGPFMFPGSGEFESFSGFLDSIESALKKSMEKQVVLVPSLEDYKFLNVFPQPPLSAPYLSSRISILGNPSFIYVNNHLLLLNNYDLLFELSSNEFAQEKSSQTDILFSCPRFERLAYYLIFQRTLSPVMPSKNNISYGPWLNMDIAPDILITSSRLKEFHCSTGPSTVLNIGPSSQKFHTVSSREGATAYSIEAHGLPK